jgi:hypothetical protein
MNKERERIPDVRCQFRKTLNRQDAKNAKNTNIYKPLCGLSVADG